MREREEEEEEEKKRRREEKRKKKHLLPIENTSTSVEPKGDTPHARTA